ncbi:DUF935 family protein [Candidatus Sumerlaeota bacterium]|nr:DUF935 family protein [Candidatus Sumerlaeota bacterium]MBI3736189.1 DUF935 family protein [Candidatus Sumerlaeota bacterium]
MTKKPSPESVPQLAPDLAKELAVVPRPQWTPQWGERVNRHIARSEGFNQSMTSVWGQGVYALFEEMEEKDAHLYSILQTRKNGILARPRTMEPASSWQDDLETAAWIERTLETIPDWEGALVHLLGALAQGMAVLEIIWGYDARGRIIPLALKPRAAWRFNFGPDGALHLSDGISPSPSSPERTGQAFDANRSTRDPHPLGFSPGRRLPERKFIVMLFNATDERPYGRGLCERVYWYWWFKKTDLTIHN